jgi:hypothetical protein
MERVRERFGKCGAQISALVRARDGWWLGEMVQAAQPKTQPQPEMAAGSGRSQPNEVSPPTAKFPEEKPQKCPVGRDAVQITVRKEALTKEWIAGNPLLQHELGADGQGANPQHGANGRNNFRKRASKNEQSARTPGGRKAEVARRGNISQCIDGPGRAL